MIMFLNIEKWESSGKLNNTIHLCYGNNFNYFSFAFEKSYFKHQFGIADGSEYYNSHETLLLWSRSQSEA